MLNITDDLDTLLDVLPPRICEAVRARPNNYALLEIVLDLGRLPEARYPHEEAVLSEQ
jgi:stage III sporulation protein SpoIIIAA